MLERIPAILRHRKNDIRPVEAHALPGDILLQGRRDGRYDFVLLTNLAMRDLIWSRIARRKADPEHIVRQYFTIAIAGTRALKL